MKKWIILAMLLVTKITANGQYLTADELIGKTRCQTFPCLSTELDRKGFSLQRSYVDGDEKFYSYWSNQYTHVAGTKNLSRPNLLVFNLKSKGEGTTFKALLFSTPIESSYRRLLNEFEKRGFKKVGEVPDGKGGKIITGYIVNSKPLIALDIEIEKRETDGESYSQYSFKLMAGR